MVGFASGISAKIRKVGSFHAKSANFFKKLHQMLHIFMKFGTLVDLIEIIRMQKKFLKILIIFEVTVI